MWIQQTSQVKDVFAESPKHVLTMANECKNSVFECELTDVQFCLLKEQIRSIIDTEVDSVRFYHLNRNENRRVEVLGMETAYNVDSAIII